MISPVENTFLSLFKIHVSDDKKTIELLWDDQRIQKIASSEIGLTVPITTEYNCSYRVTIPPGAFRELGGFLWRNSQDFKARFSSDEEQNQATILMLDIVKGNEERKIYGKRCLSITREEIKESVLQILSPDQPQHRPRLISIQDELLLQASSSLQGRVLAIFHEARTEWELSTNCIPFPPHTIKTLDIFVTDSFAKNIQSIPIEEIQPLINFTVQALDGFQNESKYKFLHLLHQNLTLQKTSTEIVSQINELFHIELVDTAQKLGLSPPKKEEWYPRKITTEMFFSDLAETNNYQLLPDHRNLAPYLQHFISTYNAAAKDILIQNVQKLGLKLPSVLAEKNIHECISSRDDFLAVLAARNCYAILPYDQIQLCECPSLQTLADLYEQIAHPLRKSWLSKAVFSTILKIVKETKRGLKIYLPVQVNKVIGTGTTKKVESINLFKPLAPILGVIPSPVAKDYREKNKAIAQPNKPNYQNFIIEECRKSQIFFRAGVRNAIHMRKVTIVTIDSEILGCGAMSELCTEGSLPHFIKCNSIPARVQIKLAKELCQAISDLHRIGYCHNDLKEDNIFITRDTRGEPTVRVGDFGNSRRIHDLTTFTCAYITPEQYETALSNKLIPSRPSSDAYLLGNCIALLWTKNNALLKEELTFQTMIEQHFIENTRPPRADHTKQDQIRQRYTSIYDHWKKKAEQLSSQDALVAPLLMHLLDPNATTRWSAQQALDFLESLPPMEG